LKKNLFLGNITGSIFSWNNVSWVINKVIKNHNLSEESFCKMSTRVNFFMFPEARTQQQAERLCMPFG
jgi:hypothetical protein